ncbi:DUF6114 domain-containing protein [Saccharopolyspora phatthalungensis]|uniref:CHASE2 domain-containing sensor protein n=1 Tax=Saccharopolyspora phatthalungensis TaxID=664693 RepID=A0A840QFP6_9PSEU|nr:DUF6114 domain-containing protein [Saccharopolyspora phatthalungensis]MBB5158901.1 CHASE2 domain-containing sensor protein [Saccharopolyspora phatthalungensis]
MARGIGDSVTAFSQWRATRPFLAGLLTLFAGMELAVVPVLSVRFILIQGGPGIGSLLVAAALVGCGILLWTKPWRHNLLGAGIIALAFTSYVTTNLGGFLIGMVLALIGGALAVSWRAIEK